MRVGINPISNSPQRTQQKQQSFGAYTYAGKLDEIRPMLEKARPKGLKIFTPEEIMKAIQKIYPDETDEFIRILRDDLRKIIGNLLFSNDERLDIEFAAEYRGFVPAINKAREICRTQTPLPLEELKKLTS